MSNINSHGVGMNNINSAAHFQELTYEQAAAIQGGAQIILYKDADFRGDSLLVTGGPGEVFVPEGPEWNDSVSSIRILSGVWTTATNSDGSGLSTTNEPNNYAKVPRNLNDSLSFFKVEFG